LIENVVFATAQPRVGSLVQRFNVIICRNVMIYFDRTLQERVHRLFFDSLMTFGVLGSGTRNRFASAHTRRATRSSIRARSSIGR